MRSLFVLWWFSNSDCWCCGPINWMWFKHTEFSNTKRQNNSLNLTFTPLLCASVLSPTLAFAIRCMWEASSKLQEVSSFFPGDTTKTVSVSYFFSVWLPQLSLSPHDCSQFFWCVVFAPSLEMSCDPSFMVPRSLLHQKLWFAPASTAAIEIPIISPSAGTSLHWHFLKIAVTSKASQEHSLCLFYSLFTSPAFAVT